MITIWMAPWQSLTKEETPSDVNSKICTVLDNGDLECIHYQEVWKVDVVTQTITTQSEVNLVTTVSGPGVLLVETIHMTITATLESVSLSTTMLLEAEIETKTTSKRPRLVTRTEKEGSKSTVDITKEVKYKSTKAAPTTTVRVISTATQYVGTITRTKTRPRPTFIEQ
ncbi:hypothetical protein K469DRAFT_311422 [Zopfia rhizophila CBS 207.26]|uniref:Uncharacterized protein n=1 Tax=Zopfia rhizophila CBS 207.26 TaxID=1314779 RepID=A0A6A6EMY5_9PEZI|nr:hypothetical protein K469DRAFT_311422 [Zopfia rhizophila CBS 207.26]